MNKSSHSNYTEIPKAAFGKLLLNEARLAKRTPYSIALGIAVPLILLIIFGAIPALHQKQAIFGGQSYFSISVPALIGFAIIGTSFIGLPSVLVTYRERGILRRFSVTPVPPSWLLAAQIILNIGVSVLGLALLMIIGILAFGLGVPKSLFGFILVIMLNITSLFAVGIFVTAVSRTNTSAKAIGGLLLYVLLFFGGLWIPLQEMPHALREVSNWTPLGASVSGLQNAMQGSFPTGQSLTALLLYTVVFGYLAIRYFKWE